MGLFYPFPPGSLNILLPSGAGSLDCNPASDIPPTSKVPKSKRGQDLRAWGSGVSMTKSGGEHEVRKKLETRLTIMIY